MVKTTDIKPHAFISYSRRDSEFVRALYALLIRGKYNVWIDFENIELSESWWSAIEKGIQESDMMIIVLSDEWLASPVCHKEAFIARQLNKRIIPIHLKDHDKDECIKEAVSRYKKETNLQFILDIVKLEQLADENYNFINQLNYISYKSDMVDSQALIDTFTALEKSMNSDIEYIRNHTTYTIHARNWEEREKRDEFLLLGSSAVSSHEWLLFADRDGKTPSPTLIQREFIEESFHSDRRRRRIFTLTGVSAIVLLILVVATGILLQSTSENLSAANIERELAEDQILILGNTLTPLPQTEQAIITTLDAGEQLVATSIANVSQSRVTLTAVQDEIATAEENAIRSADQSRSLELSTSSQQARLIGQYDHALSLAYEANAIENPPFEAQIALVNALADTVVRDRIDLVPNDLDNSPPLQNAVHSADGSIVVYDPTRNRWAEDVTLNFWYSETNEFYELVLENSSTPRFALSRDGRCLLISASGNNNRPDWFGIYDTIDHEWLLQLEQDNPFIIDINSECDQIALRTTTGIAIFDIQSRTVTDTIEIDIPQNNGRSSFQSDTRSLELIRFSPDNTYLIAVSGTIMWQVSLTEMAIKLSTDTNLFVDQIAFSPDNSLFAISGGSQFAFTSDFAVMVYDSLTGHELYRLQDEHTNRVTAITFTTDRQLASASNDRSIILWDLDRNGVFARYTNGHKNRVDNLFMISDQNMMSISWDGEVITWDVSQMSYLQTLSWHRSQINDLIIISGQKLALSASNDQIVLWDMLTGQPVRIFNGQTFPAMDIDFSMDENLLVSVGFVEFLRESVVFWDIDEPNTVIETGLVDTGQAISLIPQRKIYAVGEGSTVQLIPYGKTEAESRLVGILDNMFNGHSGLITALDTHPSGEQVISSDGNGRIIIWQLDSDTAGDVEEYLDGHAGTVNDVRFDSTGQRAVSGGDDNLVIVWDTNSGNILNEFRGHDAPVYKVAFHPIKNWIISTDASGTILVWDSISGVPLRRYKAHEHPVTALAISDDGNTMLTGDIVGNIYQWTLEIYPQSILSFAYDNRYMPELTCGQRIAFGIVQTCNSQGIIATRTPMPTQIFHNVYQPTALVNRTPFPTFTPLPSPQIAQLGDNRGEIQSGETAIWYYEPKEIGETLDIHGISSDFNTLIRIYDPDGEILLENFNHIAVLAPTALLEGIILEHLDPYRIDITSVNGAGSGEYNLSLQTRLQEPTRPLRLDSNSVENLLDQLKLFSLIPIDVSATRSALIEEYEIDLSRIDNRFLFQPLSYDTMTNFIIDTTITIKDGTDTDYCGINFRRGNDPSIREWYSIQINNDKFIWLEEWVDSWRMKHRVLNPELIDIDKVMDVRFTLTNYDELISLFINGEEVLLVEDESHQSGQLSFIGSTFADSNDIICNFTNTYIWILDE